MLLICPECETIFRVNRLRGALRNIGLWSGHAAPLQLRLTRLHGVILNETVIGLKAGLLPPISKAHFSYSLILTQAPRPKLALF